MHHKEPCLFPSLAEEEGPIDKTDFIRVIEVETSNVTLSPGVTERKNLVQHLQLAWAVLLQAFVGSETVTFGMTETDTYSTDRPDALENINKNLRIISTTADSSTYLHEIEFTSVQETSVKDKLTNTVLWVVQNEQRQAPSLEWVFHGSPPLDVDLILIVELFPDAYVISLAYRCSLLTPPQAANVSSTFQKIFNTVQSDPSQTIRDIDMISSRNWDSSNMFNYGVLPSEARCLHSLVEAQAQENGDRICIESWDGSLTYSELNQYSDLLCWRLRSEGVQSGDFIPFCMEKSMCAIVGILGILKAGAACSPLDPSYPSHMLDVAVKSCASNVVVVSTTQASRFSSSKAMIVSIGTLDVIQNPTEAQNIHVRSSDVAFLMWTSGSTGNPKGVLLNHSALSLSTKAYAAANGFTSTTRTFQFTSFTFTASLCDIFGTFANGACLCLPSESQRLDELEASIKLFRANFAWLTTTSLSGISPENVPDLRAVTVGGETLSTDKLVQWSQSRRLNISYGTTETTGWCLLNPGLNSRSNVRVLGKPILPCAFICDKDNHDRPVPVGVVGELVIGGPFLSLDYFKDEEHTKAAFIPSPTWQESLNSSYTGTWYKTNDLVRYNSDGAICFVGRKQAHEKIRGQRVDLEYIEHHTKKAFRTCDDVIVEVVRPNNAHQSPILVAFVVVPHTPRLNNGLSQNMIASADDAFRERVADTLQKLSASIPSYMVPRAFLCLHFVPLTRTNKTNRRQLREQAASMPRHELLGIDAQCSNSNPSAPEDILIMQQLWSNVLGLPTTVIRLDDNFFHLSGDSAKAIQLVSLARREGIVVQVQNIFQFPNLSALVQHSRGKTNRIAQPESDGADLSGISLLDECKLEAARQCHVSPGDVEDVYPCTALQQGLMSLSLRRPGSYVSEMVYDISPEIDLERFKDAWSRVTESIPVLRTRFAYLGDHGTCQIVLKESISWISFTGQPGEISGRLRKEMSLGSRLVHFVVLLGDQPTQRRLLVMIHHSLFDRWSAACLLRVFDASWQLGSLSKQDFKPFVKHCLSQSDGKADVYWRNYIGDQDYPVFPRLPSDNYFPYANLTIRKRILLPGELASRHTLATKIRLALALVIHRLTGSSNVLFGTVSNGRSAPVEDIDWLIGATLATTPFRVTIDPNSSVDDALEMVQNQAVEMLSHEQRGLQNISRLSQSCNKACEFQTLLVVHSPNMDPRLKPFTTEQGQADFYSYGLNLSCEIINTKQVVVESYFDNNMIGQQQVTLILSQLDHTLQELHQKGSTKLNELNRLSKHDCELLHQWTKDPGTNASCIQGVIEQNCIKSPDKEAVRSWDGVMTYSELDAYANQFAGHLLRHGMAPGQFVPLLFEKSKWTVVAILAVIKSGGAFVLMDPTYPLQRLQDICKQVNAQLILASFKYVDKAKELGQVVITVDGNVDDISQHTVKRDLAETKATDILYAVFTSGSTGQPKGVLIHHSAYYASAMAQIKAWSMTSESKVLQFSSYAFDASIAEILSTLIAGACIGIMSDDERTNDLAEAVARLQANFAILTPSVARSLHPADYPSLQRVLLVGEKVGKFEIEKWAPHVKLMQGYGPAECAVSATAQPLLGIGSDPRDIGFPAGSYCWVVDVDDPNRLSPVGAVGELLIGGPIVGMGYQADVAKTESAFIQAPPWLTEFALPQGEDQVTSIQRLYKTGDLVQYHPKLDGSLLFISRKDTQAKLRGQRLELGEVEYHLRDAVASNGSQDYQVVVDIVKTSRNHTEMLIVAFAFGEPKAAAPSYSQHPSLPECKLLPLSESLTSQFLHLKEVLGKQVPSFMVPSQWFLLENIPITASGKIDRNQIREFLIAQPAETLKSYMLDQAAHQQEFGCNQTLQNCQSERLTKDEQTLRALVLDAIYQGNNASESLQAPIQMEQGFITNGGDSVGTIALVTASKKHGFTFTAIDVFSCTLNELAGFK
ncbi:Ochratoxin nonribosomal peptide synthetase [Metarhizium anisopliae]|nr:Ochratoxin nonribosomal peptide synthetase [Metarhizium anisopliae]